VAPAVPAPDAVMLDNSELTVEQTADAIIALAEKAMGGKLPQ
jgi:cytidylate kinase